MSPDRHFGRLPAPDIRDKPFRMGLLLDPLRETFFPKGLAAGTRHYRPGRILNQGGTGTCVAHGWTSKIHAAPIMQPLPMTPFELYRRLVAIDEFWGNDGEATASDAGLQFGTSVRAGAKVMQSLGYLTQYLWAESVEDVRAWHLAGFGGCVLGVNWYSGMMQTDRDGFLSATGALQGGHCVVSTGWNDRVKRNGRLVRAVRIQNSWGAGWGIGGRAWITEDDLVNLLAAEGECCAATELKVVPVVRLTADIAPV